MIDELIQNPSAVFLILAAIFYILILRFIDRLEYRLKKRKGSFSDEEFLEMMAVIRKVSCYEIFREAAENWCVPESRKDDDFRIYLKSGEIPHYVRDFVRAHKQEIKKRHAPRFPFSGSLPPSWSA